MLDGEACHIDAAIGSQVGKGALDAGGGDRVRGAQLLSPQAHPKLLDHPPHALEIGWRRHARRQRLHALQVCRLDT
jgi:hypothetical protein